jgi:hypothetical protein
MRSCGTCIPVGMGLMAAALGCSRGGGDATLTQRQAVTVSPAFAFEATPPPSYESGLVPPQVVDVGGTALLFQTVRVTNTGLGEATVQRRDAAGAYVPGSLRGVPATYGLVYSPGQRNVRVGSYGTGALIAGIDASRQVIAARVGRGDRARRASGRDDARPARGRGHRSGARRRRGRGGRIGRRGRGRTAPGGGRMQRHPPGRLGRSRVALRPRARGSACAPPKGRREASGAERCGRRRTVGRDRYARRAPRGARRGRRGVARGRR